MAADPGLADRVLEGFGLADQLVSERVAALYGDAGGAGLGRLVDDRLADPEPAVAG